MWLRYRSECQRATQRDGTKQFRFHLNSPNDATLDVFTDRTTLRGDKKSRSLALCNYNSVLRAQTI